MAFVFLIAYLVSSFVRPADWYQPLIGVRLDFFILLFVALFSIGKARWHPLRQSLSTPNLRFLVLYYLCVCVSAAVSSNTGDTLDAVGKYGKLLLLCLLVMVICNSMERVKWFNVAIWVCVGLVAVQGIQMAITGRGWAGNVQKWAGKYERVRWVGMYDGANVYSMLLNFGLAPALQFVRPFWNGLLRVLAALATGLIVVAIFFTKSRGGYLEFAVIAAMIFGWRSMREGKGLKLSHILAIGASVGLLLILGPGRLREVNDPEHSTAHRIDAWAEGLDMLKDNPVLGVGAGNWIKQHHLLAHNSFVQNLGEIGFVGTFFWVGAIYFYLKGLRLALASAMDSKERAVVFAMAASVVGLLAASSFLTTTEFDLWYILFGMLSSVMHLKGCEFRAVPADYMAILLINLGGTFTVWAAVNLFNALAA